MVSILMKISGIEAVLLVIGTGVFYVMAMLDKTEALGVETEVYCRNLSLCRSWSLLTALAAWAVALFGSHDTYLESCLLLGEHCARTAEGWMMAALVFLVAHTALALSKRGGRYRKEMAKMMSSAMRGGLLFTLMAVLLTGG